MYSRYISSLTRFSPLSLIPLDFLVIFLSSPFLVFISRVSLLHSLYSIHAAVLFSCSFIYLRMVPVFPLTVLLFLFYSPFFLPVLFFFSFLFPSHPGLFALHSPLPHSYAGHILSPLESFCSALSTCQSLLFAVPFLLGYFASDNTQGTQTPSGRLLPKLNEELRDLVIFLRSSSFVLRIRRAPHFTSVYYSSSRLPSFLQ